MKECYDLRCSDFFCEGVLQSPLTGFRRRRSIISDDRASSKKDYISVYIVYLKKEHSFIDRVSFEKQCTSVGDISSKRECIFVS